VIVDGVVVHERWYPHEIGRVWDAVTDPAALASWLMPNTAESRTSASFVFDGGAHYGDIRVETIEQVPPRTLRWRWVIGAQPTEVSIELSPLNGGTALRLEHRSLGVDDGVGFDGGWAAKLDHDLVEVLAGHRLPADVTIRDGVLRHPIFDPNIAQEEPS